MKWATAARAAAELRKAGVEVEIVRGGLGEFTALADGKKVMESSRLWYPNPFTVAKKILESGKDSERPV